jgi:hypothetical protein
MKHGGEEAVAGQQSIKPDRHHAAVQAPNSTTPETAIPSEPGTEIQ